MARPADARRFRQCARIFPRACVVHFPSRRAPDSGDHVGMRRACEAIILSLLLCSSIASAQQQRIGGQRFTPAGSEDGIFETEGADRRRILWPYVALWVHYGWNPIVLVDGNGNTVGAPVEHVVGADLAFSIAVWEGLEFGFVLPVTVFSDGDSPPPAPGTALGDFSLRVAYRIRITDD